MKELIPTNGKTMMSSREIAALTQKRHNNVLRDINNLIDQGVINESNFGLIEETVKVGFGYRSFDVYSLDYEATMCLVTGYDAHRRMAVIKRWTALESGKAQPAMVDFNDTSSMICSTFIIDFEYIIPNQSKRRNND